MSGEFSATRSAIEGFRLIRRAPGAVAVWAAVSILFYAALGVAAWNLGGDELLRLFTGLEGTTDPAAFQQVIIRLLSFYAIIGVPVLAGYVVLHNAILRAVIFPEQKAFAYLRIGMTELLTLVFSLLLVLVWVAPVGAAVFMFFGAITSQTGVPAAVLVFILVMLVMIVVMIWLGIRLSLVIPKIIHTGKLDLGGAWALTRGRFWPLLGMVVLAAIIVMVIQWVSDAVFNGFIMGALGLNSFGVGSPDLAGVMDKARQNWPVLVVVGLILSVIGTVRMVISAAPYAEAYRTITRAKPEESASVFD